MAESAEEQRIRLAKKRLTLYSEPLIKCPECPLSFAKLGSHVVQVHGYESAKEFRKAYGLDWKTGKDTTVASYREKKRKLVQDNGTINNLQKGIGNRFTKDGVSRQLVKDYWSYKRQNKI